MKRSNSLAYATLLNTGIYIFAFGLWSKLQFDSAILPSAFLVNVILDGIWMFNRHGRLSRGLFAVGLPLLCGGVTSFLAYPVLRETNIIGDVSWNFFMLAGTLGAGSLSVGVILLILAVVIARRDELNR